MLDITETHLMVRGDHLSETDYSRTAAHADALEAALNAVAEAAEAAEADPALSPEGQREAVTEAATNALRVVEKKTADLAEVLTKEAEKAGGNPYQLTQLPGLKPAEAAAQRRHAVDLFLDQLKAQPEDRRDVWLRQRLTDAALNDRKALLGGIYEAVADLGAGAYGIDEGLLEEVQEAHFQAVDPDGAKTRDQRQAAAGTVKANAGWATKKLREMGAESASAEPAIF